MEHFSIMASMLLVLLIVSLSVAEPPVSSQAYGPPSTSSFTSFSNFNSNNFNRNQDAGVFEGFRNSLSSTGNVDGGVDPALLAARIPGPKVFRHISLFVAPQEPSVQQGARIIRPQGAPDKHYQIIFVKAPSSSSAQQTEVQLPPQPEQKTLVYVLLKNPEAAGNNVRIRGPAPTKPPAPEVFFIKYKDSNGAATGGDLGQNGGIFPSNVASGSFGIPGGLNAVRSSASLSTSYGVP